MRKAESKQAYQRLYEVVRQSLNRHDPIGLTEMGVPRDEYDLETSRILPGLKKAQEHADVVLLVYNTFSDMFGTETAGAPEQYHAAAAEIWSHWKTFEAAESRRRRGN